MRQWARDMRRVLRLGLPALAVYALVLQAFLAGAAPAAAFNFPGAPICAEDSVGHDQPAPAAPHHHGLCVAQCGAPVVPGFVSAAAPAAPPLRIAELSPHARGADDQTPTVSRHRGPGARAPPQA
jgi:hypothetical protein